MTLVLIDWDDTLFPTTWSMEISKTRNVDLGKFNLTLLDRTIFQLISTLLTIADVKIVTNASMEWIIKTLSYLPSSNYLISENIEIISARDKFGEKYPMRLWKINVFNSIFDSYHTKSKNIISIGDDKYEFVSLIYLYVNDEEKSKTNYKTIRFIKYPNYEQLIKQLKLLTIRAREICLTDSHLDLLFSSKIVG